MSPVRFIPAFVLSSPLKQLATLLLFLCAPVLTYGQGDGVGTFGAAEVHDIDTIDLYSLTPTLNIRVLSKPGAIPLQYNMTMQQSCYIYKTTSTVICGGGNRPIPYLGKLLGSKLVSTVSATAVCNRLTYHIYGGWVLQTSDGLDSHTLYNAPYLGNPCASETFTTTTNDSSGYTVTATDNANGSRPAFTATSSDGYTYSSTTNTVTDPFGNTIVSSAGPYFSNGFQYNSTYTDSLNNSTASVSVSPVATSQNSYSQYTDSQGVVRQIVFAVGPALNYSTSFVGNCAVHGQTGTMYPITQIQFPDGANVSNIAYEQGPGGVGTTTGRIASFTLRTGGTISYSYPTPCQQAEGPYYQTYSFTRTTSDGTTTYSTAPNSSAYTSITTVIDPGKNKKVYYFSGTLPLHQLTGIDIYQNIGTVASPVYTLISADTICYNGNQTNCRTSGGSPVSQRDAYHTPGGMSTSSRVSETFDTTYGNRTSIARYDFGAANFTTKATTTYGSWNGTSCVAIGSNINDKTCDVVTVDNASHTLSETRYTYNSQGFTLQTQNWTGSTWLTTSATPNPNGTVATSTAPNGQVTNYSYAPTSSGGCNSLLLTGASTTVNGVAVTSGKIWDCNLGLPLTETDANGNVSHLTYDMLGRLASQTDPLNYQISHSYTPTTASTSDQYRSTTTTVDGLGRWILKQTTAGTQYNTTSNSYQYVGTNWTTKPTYPCLQPLGQPCSATETDTRDPMGRPMTVVGSNGGTSTYLYNQNDVQLTVSPAPTGEHNKVSQTEIDGLGRVKSTCGILVSGGTACGQVDSGSGIVTTNIYSFGSGTSTVASTRGSQTRTNISDALGRVTSSSTPEHGTITYSYDTVGSTTSLGDLLRVTNPDGTYTFFIYDGLHRLTDVGNSNQSATNYCKRFRFDSTNNQYRTPPAGYNGATANILGRVMEAETDDCTGAKGNLITDEWFSYDADGRMTDVWESTPHSGGYYHTTASYYSNGEVNTLAGIPGYSAFTVSLDSNGRPQSAGLGSNNLVNSIVRDGANRPTTITYFGGNTTDTYSFNDNGTMRSYQFVTGGNAETGTLTWNPNNTLQQLAITDGFNAGGTQTCTFSYDDVTRLVTDNCGSSLWNQTYSYDQYDNLTKTGNPGTSWSPGYLPANNQVIGESYDARGNTTYDLSNSYTWDVYNKLASAQNGTSIAVCGTSGTCITYDANGRAVEKNVAGAYSEFLYSPVGMVAVMSGQTASEGRLPLPGGAVLSVLNGANYVNHYDWLGTVRLQTDANQGIAFDVAYTPYGETYNSIVSPTSHAQFTGDFADLYSSMLYDTPNRELDFGAGTRWLSPDPANAGWNLYAYGTNPNSEKDPSGLAVLSFNGEQAGEFYELYMGAHVNCWCVSVTDNPKTGPSSEALFAAAVAAATSQNPDGQRTLNVVVIRSDNLSEAGQAAVTSQLAALSKDLSKLGIVVKVLSDVTTNLDKAQYQKGAVNIVAGEVTDFGRSSSSGSGWVTSNGQKFAGMKINEYQNSGDKQVMTHEVLHFLNGDNRTTVNGKSLWREARIDWEVFKLNRNWTGSMQALRNNFGEFQPEP